ncbi:hypothetical protein A252_20746, partial [Pseudomonas syringae pv. actinidiae ICMP 9855]
HAFLGKTGEATTILTPGAFHKANAEVSAEMFIVAGSSDYYNFIRFRDSGNLDLYKNKMFFKYGEAMHSTIRKQN